MAAAAGLLSTPPRARRPHAEADGRGGEIEAFAEAVFEVALEAEMQPRAPAREQHERRRGDAGLGEVENFQPLRLGQPRSFQARQRLSSAVGTRRWRASAACSARGSSSSTPSPVRAEITRTGA